MSVARGRLTMLAVLFGVLTLLLMGHLWSVMISGHERWLERSYRNRWAFRDVPSQRGSIYDARGVPLAKDQPAFQLELHYRGFRRQHPVGLVVHGAQRWADRLRSGDVSPVRADLAREFAYSVSVAKTQTGDGAAQVAEAAVTNRGDSWAALDVLLELPLERTRAGANADPAASDLRFYVARTVSRLLDRNANACYRDLRAGPSAGREDVAAWLGSDGAAALRRAFAASLAELRALDRSLLEAGGRGLLAALDRRRRAYRERTASEDVVQIVHRQLPFELAAEIEQQRERFGGLRLRPTVMRIRAFDAPVPSATVQRPEASAAPVALGEAMPSLAPIVGFVRPLWGQDDPERIRERVDAMLQPDVVDELLGASGEGLPGLLYGHLQAVAQGVVRRHYRNHVRIGSNGAERAMDRRLAGRPGLRFIERDKSADEKGLWNALDTAPGADVHLTIDLRLQRLLERALDAQQRRFLAEFGPLRTSAEGGQPGDRAPPPRRFHSAFALIDARTGDILALAGRSKDGNERRMWSSPAVSWPGNGYIGSTVKPFVMIEHLDALRHGRPARPEHEMEPCERYYQFVGERGVRKRLRCDSVHGQDGLERDVAIAKSCNVFFFQSVEGLGRDGLERALRRFGLDRNEPGTAQPKVTGLVGMAAPRWIPRGWVLPMQGIGYGIESSVLHLARAYAAIATGALPTVRVVRGADRAPSQPLGVHPDDLATVQAGLRQCVETGTARRVIGLERLGVIGKTGTAEISSKQENNAWFAGIAGSRRPLAFAAVVYRVPSGDHGGDVAAPLVAEFLGAVAADPELRAKYLPEVAGASSPERR